MFWIIQPSRRAARMRQRDQVKWDAVVVNGKPAADHRVEPFEGDELRDRELADRDDEMRLQQRDLVVHPA